MGWKKQDFVNAALEEIGYAAFIFDIMPEQQNSVLQTLDAMVGTWNAKGIRIGYPLPSSPNKSVLTDDTNVPDAANEAIWTNLAVRIAGKFGKQISPDTKQIAKDSYNGLIGRLAMPKEMQFPATTPQGQGNKPFRRTTGPFLNIPDDNLTTGNDGELTFE